MDIDPTKCPVCGGPTTHDRCLPPNPYVCDDCLKREEDHLIPVNGHDYESPVPAWLPGLILGAAILWIFGIGFTCGRLTS